MGIEGLAVLCRLPNGRTQWELAQQLDTSGFGVTISALPGRGLGLVASRPFKQGERVIAEAPLVTWESSADADGAHDFAQLSRLIDGLSESERRDFYHLCDKRSFDGTPKSVAGIWNSNSFKAEDVLGKDAVNGSNRSCVFRICSRFNHACKPNCHVAWNASLGKQTVHVLADVDPGTELTIAYIAGAEAADRASRQALLSAKYLFTCQCGACGCGSTPALEASDARMRRIATIHTALAASPKEDELLRLVEEQLELMRTEGVPLIWARAGMLLAIVHLKRISRYEDAAKWAERGAAHARLALGDDSSAFLKFSSLAEVFAAAAASSTPSTAATCAATPVTPAASQAATTSSLNDAQERSAVDGAEEPNAVDLFERGPAEEWDEVVKGPRTLRFHLVTARARYADKIWPAAQVLARWLEANPELASERRVLEIGAGAALPSVVASLLGARATVASDYPDRRMIQNIATNLVANLPQPMCTRTVALGFNWRHSPQPLFDALEALLAKEHRGSGSRTASSAEGPFDLILLSDLLYECEHEEILRVVAACLSREKLAGSPRPCALLTYQLHDECQSARQAAFFDMAPRFGLVASRLHTVAAPKQFEEVGSDEEEEDGHGGDGIARNLQGSNSTDVTRQVQLWELVHQSDQYQ